MDTSTNVVAIAQCVFFLTHFFQKNENKFSPKILSRTVRLHKMKGNEECTFILQVLVTRLKVVSNFFLLRKKLTNFGFF